MSCSNNHPQTRSVPPGQRGRQKNKGSHMETFARPISSGTRPRKIPKRPDLVLWGSEDHSRTKKIRIRTIFGVFGLWFAKELNQKKFRIFPEISRKSTTKTTKLDSKTSKKAGKGPKSRNIQKIRRQASSRRTF